MEKKLHFLICGAQKAGTTALASYLRQHPGIFIPEQKELHFFDDECQNWNRPNWRRYHHHFRDAGSRQIWGEATPIYMYWDASPERIWRYNPEVRLIVILRNPITRAYSHWSMEKGRGAEMLSFDDALHQEWTRSRAVLPLQDRIHSYTERGYYVHQLRRLWRFFGRDSVLVLRQEDLSSNPLHCVNQVLSHIGAPTLDEIRTVHMNRGNYQKPMSSGAASKLRELYWHEICQLEGLLGWDCQQWLKHP